MRSCVTVTPCTYVETGAGVGSGFSDAQYEAAGAIIADTNTVWEKADLYYKVMELFPGVQVDEQGQDSLLHPLQRSPLTRRTPLLNSHVLRRDL